MEENLALFPEEKKVEPTAKEIPLAHRLRPSSWDDFFGIDEIDPGLALTLRAGKGIPPSMILLGPPGSGKTTLAKLVGKSFDCEFVEFSAVLGGVKEVREIVDRAKFRQRKTILFVDEIHRFNKGQQDAFLPHVEDGTIVLIGATTENPSFYLTSALLSRCKVVTLPKLSSQSMRSVVAKAEPILGISFESDAVEFAVNFVSGDARRLLNLIEGFAKTHRSGKKKVSREDLVRFSGDKTQLFYDRDGEEHYNMASAFIKSMRGSDPDAALYWGFRMIESGEDPRFILRRMVIFASEDIGNADPRAITLAVSAFDAFEKVGLPEGRIPLAQCITYLATAPKSNRSYVAMNQTLEAISQNSAVAVPLHLRNAPTSLMRSMKYGENYKYPHDYDEGDASQQYLPEELKGSVFYRPKESGYEKMIIERQELRKKGK